jgi:molybdenum cofactor synthesis domain-containing protein
MGRTAAVVVIGDEVLSGKVREENAAFLIGRLRELGVSLRRVLVVPDEMSAIDEALSLTVGRYDHVFCSGGIGPTHDDLTVEAVAAFLKVPVVRAPELVDLVRTNYRERSGLTELPEEAFRLAEVPEGARLIRSAELWYPAIAVKELYLLPGVPSLFRMQFEVLAEHFRDAPFFLRAVYLSSGEVAITAALDAVVARHPAVQIGSYPRFDAEADHRVKLTVEAREQAAVEAAFRDLLNSLPKDVVLRTE